MKMTGEAPEELIDRAVLLNILEDVTEASEDLLKAKNYTDNIIKSMVDSLIVVSPEGKIRTVNPATEGLLGYREGELVGKPISGIFAEGSRLAEIEGWREILVAGTAENYEMVYRTRDGQEIPVSLSLSVMRDTQGDIIGVVAVAKDMRETLKLITNLERSRGELQKAYEELKETHAQLIQSDKMSAVGQLAAGVVHELNNPLAGVLNMAQLLLMEMPEDTPAYGHLKLIEKASLDCKRIVQSILTFSRQSKEPFGPIDIHEVIENTLVLIGYQLKLEKIKVFRDFAPDLSPVMGNANQIQQVVMNMLTNARDAIAARRKHGFEGEIRISTGIGANKSVEIRVQDNGCGIAKENVDRVFDTFFTTKGPGAGVGLGLSVSYGIVKDHNGDIRAESEGKGKGATFTVRLPIAL